MPHPLPAPTPLASRSPRERADLYWRLLDRAEERGDSRAAERYLSLLAVHDDGRYVDLVEGTATLEIDSDPDGAEVVLIALGDGSDSARGAERSLGTTPLPPLDLPPGRYLLELRLRGCAPARRTLRLRRGSDVQLQVTLFRAREIGADFVYVPAGRFRQAGTQASAPREHFVDNFAIARDPVTIGEYMLFIDDLADSDPGRAIAFTPRHDHAADPHQPVTGLGCEAAGSYVRWLSQRGGACYRLPREDEHAKALDVDASGASIYEVRDVAGGVEWTSERVTAARGELSAMRGNLRLVRTLASGGGELVTPPVVPELDTDLPEPEPEPEPELDVDVDVEVAVDVDGDEARRELLGACAELAAAADQGPHDGAAGIHVGPWRAAPAPRPVAPSVVTYSIGLTQLAMSKIRYSRMRSCGEALVPQ